MNFEKMVRTEQIGKNRERLLAMEKEGKVVFHGSTEVIDSLEPRQAYGYDEKTGKTEKDGEPAVFATPFADVAIFRALINKKGVGGESSSEWGIDDSGIIHFKATQNLLDAAKSKVGLVYVLDRDKFEEIEGTQCRSGEGVSLIEAVEVTAGDLPGNIEVI